MTTLLDALRPDPDRDGALTALLLVAPRAEPSFLETDLLPALCGMPARPPSPGHRLELSRRLAELDCAVLLQDARHEIPAPRPAALDVVSCALVGGRPLSARLVLALHERSVRLLLTSAGLHRAGFREDLASLALLEAHAADPAPAPLLKQALDLPADLGRWLSREVRDALDGARRLLERWSSGRAPAPDAVHWSSPSRPLVPALLARWPDDEPIRRVRVVSPHWSLDGLTAGLLDPLRKATLLQAGAELKLICAPHRDARGRVRPRIPAELTGLAGRAIGLSVTALSADPFTGHEPPRPGPGRPARRLAAHLIVLEGPHTTVAYVGSAAPTRDALGAGDDPTRLPLDAGLILRRCGDGRAELAALVPRTAGPPLPLTAIDGTTAVLVPPLSLPPPPSPPALRRALLCRAPDTRRLELALELSPERLPPGWSLESPRGTLLHRAPPHAPATEHLRIDVSTSQLAPLLAAGAVHLVHPQWPSQTLSVNLAPDLVPELAFGPPPALDALVAHLCGHLPFGDALTAPSAPPASQGDRVRDALDAIAALTEDLPACTRSAATQRLALFGPTGPVSFAARLADAARAGRVTPTAAAFLIVELIASVRATPERVAAERRIAFAHALRAAERRMAEHLATIAHQPQAPTAARLYKRLREAATGEP